MPLMLNLSTQQQSEEDTQAKPHEHLKALTKQMKDFSLKYKSYNSARDNKDFYRKIAETEEVTRDQHLLGSKVKQFLKETAKAEDETKLPYAVKELIEQTQEGEACDSQNLHGTDVLKKFKEVQMKNSYFCVKNRNNKRKQEAINNSQGDRETTIKGYAQILQK